MSLKHDTTILYGSINLHHDNYSGQQCAFAGMTRKWDSSGCLAIDAQM